MLVTAFVLRVLVALTPDIEIDGLGTALLVALLVVAVGYGTGLARSVMPALSFWLAIVYSCVSNILAVVIAAAVLPGVRARGPASLVSLGVLLTFLNVALAYGWQAARGAGILSVAG